MNEIELALEYARKNKINRLKKNKINRRKSRGCFSKSSTHDSFDIEQSTMNRSFSINLTLSDKEDSDKIDIRSASPMDNDEEEKRFENVGSLPSTYECIDFDDICGDHEISDLNLHPYTTISCFSYAKDLIHFIRKTNISKTHANQLVALIQSALPQPNTLPITYSKILNLLSSNFIYLIFIFPTSYK